LFSQQLRQRILSFSYESIRIITLKIYKAIV
jgi:hypothetical protein